MRKAAIYNLTWDSLGGGERYTAEFAQVLEKTGEFDIDIWWPKDLRQNIIDRFGINLEKSRFSPFPGGHFANYDLVFWLSDGSIPLSLAKKTILHFQIPFHSPIAGTLSNKIKAQLLLSVSNSYFTKEIVDKTYNISSKVIYPPVDTSLFIRGRKENLIVSVARLSNVLHAKRQDVLIEAFAKLHKSLPDWKFVIAGGSQDISYYHQLLKSASGLPIKIMANPTLPQIQELFAKAKLFWSATGYGINPTQEPEKVEHFGITPVEAMAAGVVPVVVAAGGHQESVVPGKTGFLWKTIDELVDFSLELALNYRKWGILSKKSQLRSKIFDREVFTKKYLDLI